MLEEKEVKTLALLGATGSIGTQALEVVRQQPGRFRVAVLSAQRQWELLARQAREFRPAVVVIGDDSLYQPLKAALAEQLNCLTALIDRAVPATGHLAPAVAEEAGTIVASLDQLVAATLRRK